MHIVQPSVLRVLSALIGKDGLDQRQIENVSRLSHVTISTAVRMLKERGMVCVDVRGPSNVCMITDKGERFCKAVKPFV